MIFQPGERVRFKDRPDVHATVLHHHRNLVWIERDDLAPSWRSYLVGEATIELIPTGSLVEMWRAKLAEFVKNGSRR